MRNSTEKWSTGERPGWETEYKRYFSFFSEVWNDQKPLAKLFRTSRHGYLYDTGTNKLIECEDLVFDLLQHFFSTDVESSMNAFIEKHGKDKFVYAANAIKQSIENCNILKFKKAKEFYLTSTKCSVAEMIQEYQELLVLEVTERCNLRCEYCIYRSDYNDFRSHSNRDMSREIAEKSLIHLKNHSSKQDSVGITFYGGEPILSYSLIEWCVTRAKALFNDKKLTFSVTTNGTLISPEIAGFLYKNNFLTQVSIDGPAFIQDRFRKYHNGNGCYSDAIRGLKY